MNEWSQQFEFVLFFILKIAHLHRFTPERKKHSSSGIAKLCNDKLLHKYNWNGTNHKLAMNDLPIFTKVCFGETLYKF